MGFQHIKLEKKHGLAVLTLCREPLNVLNIAMMKEINAALDSLKDETLKALLFRARGKAFCAGVDVGEHLGERVKEMIEVFHGMFRRLDGLGVVSVASLQGAALGGGCELALFCDMVVASEKAKLGQPEIQVGVFPPIAALVLPRQMGYKKAMELILTGEEITAQQALELGLVNKVVPPEQLEEATNELTGKLLKLSAPVLKLTKKAVLKGLLDDQKKGLAVIEDIYLNELMKTQDADEGLRAFLEKRAPVWRDE